MYAVQECKEPQGKYIEMDINLYSFECAGGKQKGVCFCFKKHRDLYKCHTFQPSLSALVGRSCLAIMNVKAH